MDDKQIKIEAWKQTIAVQMHFNDLELRIRAFGLTTIGVILGIAGLDTANANRLVLAAAIVIWPAFFLMEIFWYHPLLKAAVQHGEIIENTEPKMTVLDLTKSITAASSENFLGAHSEFKMFLYYLIVWGGLWLIFFATRTP